MSTNEMTSKVRELKELKALADELAAEIATIEDAIKAEMTRRNAEELTVDVYKVRWTTITGTRFDTNAFRKAQPDLYGQFTKTTTTRRFTVA